eukprot:COSAG01_NODE_1664_length_9573_cov_31.637429_5_plen_104_part_00
MAGQVLLPGLRAPAACLAHLRRGEEGAPAPPPRPAPCLLSCALPGCWWCAARRPLRPVGGWLGGWVAGGCALACPAAPAAHHTTCGGRGVRQDRKFYSVERVD